MKFLLCFACTIFCATSHAEDILETRIVGGSPSQLGEFPFVAGIYSYIPDLLGFVVCSGALLRNNLLITAAHCWFNGTHQAYIMTVIVGTIDLHNGGVRQNTSNVITHPEWTPSTYKNDIALVNTLQPFEFSPTISAVGVPSVLQIFDSFAGQRAVALGFGLTNSSVITYDHYLSHVELQVITNEDCYWRFAPNLVTQCNICTASDGGKGTCGGDSGGPLVLNTSGTWILIGVTSFGDVVCESDAPSVYSRITEFLAFIDQYL